MSISTPEAKLFVLALGLRLAAFFVLLMISSPGGFSIPIAGSDSLRYIDAAHELRETGTFVDAAGVPRSYEVPGYPLFLAAVPVLYAAVMIQIVLAAASAVLIYRVGSIFSKRAGILAGILFAADPTGLVYSNLILTETLFIFLLLVAIWALIAQAHTPKMLLLSGAFLGMATMVRPVGEIFIPAFVVAVAVMYWGSWRKVLVSALIVAAGFLLVVGPWLVRNKLVFDRWELSPAASFQYATAHAPMLYAHLNDVPKKEAITLFYNRLSDVSPFGGEQTLWNAPYMWHVAFEYLREHPLEFAQFHLVRTIPLFLSDGWRELAERVDLLQGGLPDLGGFLLRRDFSGLAGAITENKTALVLFLGGAGFWAIVNLSMALGVASGIKERGRRAALVVLAVLIILASAAVAGGAVSHPRYRFSVSPLMFVLASVGFWHVVAFSRTRWLHRGS